MVQLAAESVRMGEAMWALYIINVIIIIIIIVVIIIHYVLTHAWFLSHFLMTAHYYSERRIVTESIPREPFLMRTDQINIQSL
jgi:flagellar basal body-associated protein FliL